MAFGDKILSLRKDKGWSQQKLASVFRVTLDYLVDDTGDLTDIKDRAILDRLLAIEKLQGEDKKTIVHVINSLLRDAKARKTYYVQQ